MKLMLKCFVILFILVQSVMGASDRYLVESNLTKVAQKTLDAMFGDGNFVANVTVTMIPSRYSVKYTEESNPKKSNNPKPSEEVYILPGVPALKNIAPDSLNQLPFDSVTTLVESKIKKIVVIIIKNKKYPRNKAKRAKSALYKVLGMDSKRGDDIIFSEQDFYENPNKNTQQITIVPGQEDLLTFQNGFYLLLIILVLVGIVTYIIFQNKLLNKETDSGESSAPSINVNPNLELPDGLGGGGSSSMNVNMNANIKTYFDFVTEHNINDFIFLIKSQKLKPDYISYIISFLSPKLSSKIINELDLKVQAQVMLLLSTQQLGDKIILEKLEKKLKTDLECFVGGELKVENLSNAISSSVRKQIVLSSQKINPRVYKNIRPFMILFDDIKLLDEIELQVLLSDVNLEQLAVALVDVDQDVFSSIMDNLTKGAKDMVEQYLELKASSTTASEKEKAQDSIIRMIKKFELQGKINLADKLKNI